MPSPFTRRTALVAAGAALAAVAVAAPAAPSQARPSAPAARTAAAVPADARSASYTDPAGTRSTYHLFTSQVAGARPAGLVVYLDGDGMYGHDHPSSTWALGGSRGVVAEAGKRGFATLSIRTPDRRGVSTFWEDGRTNAAYVAALTRTVSQRLGVSRVWFVGYSGGSQLITKFLLPVHGKQFAAGGGSVIAGGGGAPRGAAQLTVGSRYPLTWYTGSHDDGRGTDDGYDALDDAKRGAAWYRARGANVTRLEPQGLDHEDLGGRFGSVLGSRLDHAGVARAR